MTAMLAVDPTNTKEEVGEQDVRVIEMVTDMFSTMDSNDLGSLKSYLESGKSGIESYTNAVEYSYGVTPQIFRQEETASGRYIRTNLFPQWDWARQQVPTV